MLMRPNVNNDVSMNPPIVFFFFYLDILAIIFRCRFSHGLNKITLITIFNLLHCKCIGISTGKRRLPLTGMQCTAWTPAKTENRQTKYNMVLDSLPTELCCKKKFVIGNSGHIDNSWPSCHKSKGNLIRKS